LLEDRVGRVFVAGEISNVHRAASGHFYFSLVDDRSQLRAALFRGNARRLAFDPEDGLQVVVSGELTVYEPRGDLQLLVRHMEPQGQGALQLAFEQLRARLEAEGLFDADRKRSLPGHPRCVGVVTSPSGAAVRDVIEVSGRLFPATPLLISPTRVQGDGAEAEIEAALAALRDHDDVDVVLLVRGGGSLEDLMAFNTERVARAIRQCPVPVVSGVGHEVDVTIADLAADVRAPTPSAAAALALPDRAEMAARIARELRQLTTETRHRLHRAQARLARAAAGLRAGAPLARVAAGRARYEAAQRALAAEIRQSTAEARGRLVAAAGQLDALSPLAVLGRGYAIVERAADAVVVRRAAEVELGDALHVRLGSGSLEASVTGRDAPEDS